MRITSYVLPLVGVLVASTEAVPCSSQHLAVFNDVSVAGPIHKCMSASEIKFPMPPTSPLSTSQREQLCDERECKEMIAAIDDLEVPRCELLVNGKNETLQASLDRFTAICDVPRTIPPMKKKRNSEASSGTATVVCPALIMAVAVVLTASL